MHLSSKSRAQCRQPHSSAGPRQSRPLRCLRCSAKRKGEQKNEGMYFTYEQVPKPGADAGNKSSEKQKQEFSWVNSARSSVQQYRQAPHKRTNKPPQQQSKQQPRQQQGQQPASTAEAAPVLQPRPVQRVSAEAAPVAEAQQPPAVVADDTAAPAAATQRFEQQQAGTAATPGSTGDVEAEVLPQQSADISSNSGSSSRATKENVLAKRKQQLLQRLKGSAETITTASAAASAVAAAGPAAAAPLVPSPAAAETTAPADSILPGLDGDGELLLQELLDMAQELTDPNSTAAAAEDSDPFADPLADILPDVDAESPNKGNGNGQISITELGIAAAGGDQEAADIFATITAMQQRMQSAVAADDLHSSSMFRVKDLLSWEAEEAAKSSNVTDLDVDAELDATRKGDYGELPVEDEEGEWEYVEDDEGENEGELDDSWYENDPELRRLLAADGADFAKLLAELNDMPDSNTPPGSSSGAAAAAAAAGEQQEAWASLGAQDWLEAVADDSNAGDAVVVDDDAVLSDVISAIQSDASLDDRAKVEARLRIQGMFNDPTAAAGGARRSSRGGGRRQQQQQQERDEGPVEKGPTTTGAAAAGEDDEQLPVLLPRPVRPSQ